MQGLIEPGGGNLDQVGAIMARAAAVRDSKLSRLAEQEAEAERRKQAANTRIIEGLRAERDELALTDRQRFISQALRRLSAEATDAERAQVRDLAGALFDEKQAIEARTKAEEDAARIREQGKALTEELRTAEEAYAAEVRKLNELLTAGAIDQETFARASERAYDQMLSASKDWSAGVVRALRDYARESSDAAQQFEQATSRALKASEDAFVQWATTGKVSATDLFNSIAEEALRTAYRMAVIKPFGALFEGILGSIAGSLFGGSSGMVGDFPAPGPVQVAHVGGVIGSDPLPSRPIHPTVFDNAPRFHGGGVVGNEVPIIAQRGETVFTPGQMRVLRAGLRGSELGQKPEVKVNVHVDNRAPGTEARAQWRSDGGGGLRLDIIVEQIEGQIARNIGRGEGLAPTMERRYGLNPAAGAYR